MGLVFSFGDINEELEFLKLLQNRIENSYLDDDLIGGSVMANEIYLKHDSTHDTKASS